MKKTGSLFPAPTNRPYECNLQSVEYICCKKTKPTNNSHEQVLSLYMKPDMLFSCSIELLCCPKSIKAVSQYINVDTVLWADNRCCKYSLTFFSKMKQYIYEPFLSIHVFSSNEGGFALVPQMVLGSQKVLRGELRRHSDQTQQNAASMAESYLSANDEIRSCKSSISRRSMNRKAY